MRKSTAKAIVTPARTTGGVSPLDYLLRLMNDETATPARRDAAARCAVQYTHKRMADTRVPLKARAAKAADQAGEGTAWADDLAYQDSSRKQ